MHEDNDGPIQPDHGDAQQPLNASDEQSEAQVDHADHVPSAMHLQNTDASVVSEDAIAQQVDQLTMPGELLRQARERMGYSVESVAGYLKLNVSHVQAIEKDEYASMQMAQVFVKGHLRQYARHVKLEPDYIMRCYAKVDRSYDERHALQGANHKERKRLGHSKQIKKWLLIDACVIVVIVVAIYAYMHRASVNPASSQPSPVAEVKADTAGKVVTGKAPTVRPGQSKQEFTLLKEAT